MAGDPTQRRWADDSLGLTERERETAADMRLYVDVGFTAVRCGRCGAETMVKKNSRKHTSVQWTADAVARCQEIGAARQADPHALVLGCARLADDIDSAMERGDLVVLDG